MTTLLAAELEQVYGCNAVSVFSVYAKHDPLKLGSGALDQYWEHTRRFLEHLHSVLYAPGHQLSLHTIAPESYFFLTKICIDHAFTVTELINVRNDRERKYAKDMANDIAHYILPPYLTYRRQTLDCKFTGPSGPKPISAQARLHAVPFYPGQMPMPMPMPMQMPFYPGQMPMPMPMPFYPGQMPMPMPFYPGQMSMSMPMPMPMPMPMQMPPVPHAPPVPTPAPERTKPVVKRKPVCTRTGNVRETTDQDLVMPEPDETADNIPLNFYNVYCSELANKINSTAEQHHVPQVFPVSNRPPPP
jgi:hypothetical protein